MKWGNEVGEEKKDKWNWVGKRGGGWMRVNESVAWVGGWRRGYGRRVDVLKGTGKS